MLRVNLHYLGDLTIHLDVRVHLNVVEDSQHQILRDDDASSMTTLRGDEDISVYGSLREKHAGHSQKENDCENDFEKLHTSPMV